jgi:hypothetical protein
MKCVGIVSSNILKSGEKNICIPASGVSSINNNNNNNNNFVLRQVHSLSQSEFYTECDLVLPLSISSVLSHPQGHQVAAYIFFFVLFYTFLSFNNVFWRQCLRKIWPIRLTFFHFIVFRLFFSF